MSQDETPDNTPQTSPETDSEPEDLREDLREDLVDRLDEPGGMDALIAEYKAEQAGKSKRRARPVWVPVFVMAVGAYLLYGLWGDAFYAARSDDAIEDLGHARELFADGVPDGLHGKQVRLRGTPDVQHVARRKRKSGQTTGFMRVQEGGGSLFVAVPREEGRPPLEYDGLYVGRMQQMSKVPGFESLRGYFDRDGIIEIVDADAATFTAQLTDTGITSVDTDEFGTWRLRDGDEVRMVFRPALANLQLGRGTWKAEAEADAAVAGLGFPWRRSEKVDAELGPGEKDAFRSYLVAMPKAENDAIETRLNAGVPADANRADPEVGALVLPTIYAYSVAPTDVRKQGADIALVYGDNTAKYGVRVEGGTLVDRVLDGAELVLPTADLHAVRVERPVKVDPEGYIVIVGEKPSDQRVNALLFLVVFGLVLANVIALVMILRRRQTKA